MEKNGWTFLRWWLSFALMAFGMWSLDYWGMFAIINDGDVTKLSFIILAFFVFFSCYMGYETFRTCILNKPSERRMDLGWFVSDQLLTIGMIGTVIGFIYMLATTFADIDPTKINTLKYALVNMSLGMSTALYTTASGLICSLLLKIQLANLSYFVEGSNEKTSK